VPAGSTEETGKLFGKKKTPEASDREKESNSTNKDGSSGIGGVPASEAPS